MYSYFLYVASHVEAAFVAYERSKLTEFGCRWGEKEEVTGWAARTTYYKESGSAKLLPESSGLTTRATSLLLLVVVPQPASELTRTPYTSGSFSQSDHLTNKLYRYLLMLLLMDKTCHY